MGSKIQQLAKMLRKSKIISIGYFYRMQDFTAEIVSIGVIITYGSLLTP